MHFQVLSSGSAGNSALLRVGETHVMVDAGLPLAELEERLATAQVPAGKLDHVVLTHGHLDHARAAGGLSRKARARVHCPLAMMQNASVRGAHQLATLPAGGEVELLGPRDRDPVAVVTVPVPHDARPTVALKLSAQGRTTVVVTDMGRPDADVARRLHGAHLLFLEFNHDAELLRNGSDPRKLKKRVSGDTGHLSNAQAADMLTRLAGPELHTVVLGHLSRRNNTPALALAAAEGALAALGRTDVHLVVAEQDAVGANLAV